MRVLAGAGGALALGLGLLTAAPVQAAVTDPVNANGETSADATRASALAIATQPKISWATAPMKIHAGAPNQTIFGNLTVTEPEDTGFTTAYPCTAGPSTPGWTWTSVNNYVAGQTIPNFTAVKADANGDICFTSKAPTHLIWDQVSEVDPADINSHTAVRKFDTRGPSENLPPVAPRTTVRIQLGDSNQTVLGNLTVTQAQGTGFTTAYPCNVYPSGPPLTSVNNYVYGQTIPNFAAVKLDSEGYGCFMISNGGHLFWDQVAETSAMPTHSAVRKFDTRGPLENLPAQVASGVSVKLATGVPNSMVMGNLTVTGPLASGFTTVYPCNQGLPSPAILTSVNNYTAGQTIPNFAIAQADSNGDVCFQPSGGKTNLIWDQVGESPTFPVHIALRKRDTREADDVNTYAFLASAGGYPIRWNPCVAADPREAQQIDVYVNWGRSAAQEANLRTAIARLRSATGLNIVLAGTTGIMPTKATREGLNLRTQEDIVVAFAADGQTDEIPAGSQGVGGFYGFLREDETTRRAQYGYAVFAETMLTGYPDAARTTLYMHELAHVLGLAHVSDPREVLNATIYNTTTYWGNGDATGLTKVGAPAGCW